VGNYDLGPVAGTGTFATVRLARHYATGQPAVCKLIVFPEPADPRDRLHFFALREGAVMMALPPHPNVATLYEYHRSDAHVELVMSLAPGEELFSYAEKIGGAPEDECRNIAAQLLAALDHMHTHSVLHRDIKLDNVFYDPATQKVTVIDFGLATFYHPQVRLVEIIGTPSYASPPLLAMLEDGYGGMLPAKGHQDLWAFGVTLYGLATCRFPFEETDIPRLQREIILKGKKERPFPLPDSWDPERRAMAEDFLKTVLDPDNEGKITARSLLAHPWLAAGGQPPRV
ncbi:kinase-like domain-containing protein, partial [Hyaloraphidium curvatum]